LEKGVSRVARKIPSPCSGGEFREFIAVLRGIKLGGVRKLPEIGGALRSLDLPRGALRQDGEKHSPQQGQQRQHDDQFA